jgi:hypothetical protein
VKTPRHVKARIGALHHRYWWKHPAMWRLGLELYSLRLCCRWPLEAFYRTGELILLTTPALHSWHIRQSFVWATYRTNMSHCDRLYIHSYQEMVLCFLFFVFTKVRGTCRKQFCLFWLPRAVDFKVSCSQILRRAFAGIQTHIFLFWSYTCS